MLIRSTSIEDIAQGTRNVVGYLTEALEERRRDPADDLLTWTTAALKDGQPLTQDEQIGFSFNLFVGGLDTVTTNIANQTWHLARHPEHRKLLRENPALIPNAIEEFMRAYGAVTTFRTCVKEITVGGATMKPGDKVVMSTTLAGRDPAEFEAPAEVRLDRKPRHTGFGFGIHTCVGMHLARREMRIAMEELLARIPDFSIAPGHDMEFYLGVIQPVALPLVWDPAATG
jgi:cytochrome P450